MGAEIDTEEMMAARQRAGERSHSDALVSSLSPFQIMVGPDHAVAHRAWRTARDRLRDAVLAGPGLTLLVGPAGTGKSLMLEDLAQGLRKAGAGVVLQARGDIPAARLDPKMGNPLVVLVDEADRMDDVALHKLGVNGPYAVVLAGLSDRGLGGDNSVEIVRLSPLDRGGVATFVGARLASAGLPATMFGDEAITRLTKCSGGIPRLVNTIAGAALFLAERDGLDRVAGGHVAEAAKLQGGELELCGVNSLQPPPAPSAAPPSRGAALVPTAAAKASRPPPAEEPLCDADLTFVYPVAVVAKPRAGTNRWADLLSSIRAERPASPKRPPFFLGLLTGMALTAACGWLVVKLRHPAPQQVAVATSAPLPPPPPVVSVAPPPAAAPAEATPGFDDSSASPIAPPEQPASPKAAETPPNANRPGDDAKPALAVTPPPVAPPAPAAPETPVVTATAEPLPVAPRSPSPAPASDPWLSPVPTVVPVAPVTADATPVGPALPLVPVPSVTPATAGPEPSSRRATVSVPVPVVIRYPSGASDVAARAARLAAWLRAAGYTSIATLPLSRGDATPGARFYFVEDRGEAIAALRISGLPGTAALNPVDGSSRVPRPGTIELVMAK